MDIYSKSTMTPQERRQKDDIQAQLEKLQANQDYIAMMADIELEDDETMESEAE